MPTLRRALALLVLVGLAACAQLQPRPELPIETAVPAGLEGVRTMRVAGMPPRRLALIDTRDAYLSIADRAVRDSVVRLMARGGSAAKRRRAS